MNRIRTLVLLFSVAVSSFGQGTVNFQNISGTGVSGGSPITNGLTGSRVVVGTDFLVQLYYGTSGAEESQLVRASNAPIGFSSPGFFVGSTRTLAESVIGSCDASSSPSATLQVRCWQASLGPSWEVALTNCGGSGNGLMGKSTLFTVQTGSPCAMPPGGPANLNGLRSFTLLPCSAPLSFLRISNVSVTEESSGTLSAVFSVGLSPASSQTVQVSYATADGTAQAGSDYIATNGVLTFSPGQTNKFITVAVTPDAVPEANEMFTVNLSAPVNADLGVFQGTCTIAMSRHRWCPSVMSPSPREVMAW